MKYTIELDIPEIQRMLYLIHRDLARVEGNIVLARRKLDSARIGSYSLPGNVRKKAVQTIETAPAQAQVLYGAQYALQQALKVARDQGELG